MNYVIKTFREKLKPSIEIVVFYGKGRTSLLKEITKDLKNVTLVELEEENFDAKIYNDFVKSMDFWGHIKGEHLLIFQTDSMLCEASPYKLEDFLKNVCWIFKKVDCLTWPNTEKMDFLVDA